MSEIQKMIDETKLVVNLLLRNDYNDYEISKRTNIDLKKVQFYLSNHGLIMTAFCKNPSDLKEREKAEDVYKNVVQKRMNIDQNYTILEDVKVANKKALINVGLIFSKESNQIKFVVLSALTFRLKLESLSELLDRDPDFLAKKMEGAVKEKFNSLYYLFNIDYTNQDKAKRDFIGYYNELLLAIKDKDEERKKELISIIDDSNINSLIKILPEESPVLTDEQVEILLRYQLKYAYRTIDMERLLGYQHEGDYNRRITRFFEDNIKDIQIKKLYDNYKFLMEYNKRVSKGFQR